MPNLKWLRRAPKDTPLEDQDLTYTVDLIPPFCDVWTFQEGYEAALIQHLTELARAIEDGPDCPQIQVYGPKRQDPLGHAAFELTTLIRGCTATYVEVGEGDPQDWLFWPAIYGDLFRRAAELGTTHFAVFMPGWIIARQLGVSFVAGGVPQRITIHSRFRSAYPSITYPNLMQVRTSL